MGDGGIGAIAGEAMEWVVRGTGWSGEAGGPSCPRTASPVPSTAVPSAHSDKRRTAVESGNFLRDASKKSVTVGQTPRIHESASGNG